MQFRLSFIILFVLCTNLFFPVSSQDACTLAPRLNIGSLGRVTPGDPNNLRAAAARSAENIGTIPGGSSFIVLDGAECVDGLNWWQVNYNGLIGWTVEGADGSYWVEPIEATCDLMILLGQPAETLEERILYTEPSSQSQALATIPAETLLEIGTDFHCDDYLAWVFASYEGQSGWISTVSSYDSGYGGVASALAPRPRPLEPVADAAERLLPDNPLQYNIAGNAIVPANVQNLVLSQTLGEGQMTSFAWSPDGSKIAIATTLEARIYPSDNFNASPQRFDGHDGNIRTIRYSPDGRFLLTVDAHRLILRDANSFEEVWRVETEAWLVQPLFSPDGSTLALGFFTPTPQDASALHIYNLAETIEEAYNVPLFTRFAPKPFAFSSDSAKLILVEDNWIRVLDTQSGTEIHTIDKNMGGTGGIGDWTLSPDDHFITFYYAEMIGDTHQAHFQYIQTWNLETGEFSNEFNRDLTRDDREQLGYPIRLQYTPDGSLIWVQMNYSLHIMDCCTPRSYLPTPVIEGNVENFVLNVESNRIAAGGDSGEIRLYYGVNDPTETVVSHILYGINGDVLQMQFSPDGSKLAASGSDNSLRIWDVESGQRQGSFLLTGAGAPFAVNNGQLLSGLRLWNGSTGQISEQFNTGHGEQLTAGFDPDGTPLYLSRDRETGFGTLWNARSGEILFETDFYVAAADASFSRDGQYLQIDLRVYNTSDFSLINSLSTQFGSSYHQMLSPDNHLLFIFDGGLWNVEDSAAILIRDIATNDLLLNYAMPPDTSRELQAWAWSNDGRDLAWLYWEYLDGEFSDRMIIYNLETRTVSANWLIADSYRNPMLFSPDDSMLVLGNPDGTIHFYERETGELLHSFQAHGGVIKQIAFSEDGSLLYTAGDDNTIRIWQIP